MRHWVVIILSFIILALLALSTTLIWQRAKDNHYDSIPLEEQEVRKHVKKYFKPACPPPKLTELQVFIDCHNKMARKDM